MKKPSSTNSVTVNRRARYDYSLGEELVCGMSLTGPEVRQIRDHHVQLKGSFVTIKDNELWLNATSNSSLQKSNSTRLLAPAKMVLV